MSGYPRGTPETETPMWATEPLLLALREQHRCHEARGVAASGLSPSATTTPRRHFPPEAGPPVPTMTLPQELGVSLLSALSVAVPGHVGSWLAPFKHFKQLGKSHKTACRVRTGHMGHRYSPAIFSRNTGHLSPSGCHRHPQKVMCVFGQIYAKGLGFAVLTNVYSRPATRKRRLLSLARSLAP